MTRRTLATLALAAALLATGCTPGTSADTTSPAEQAAVVIEQMPPDEKALIAPGFPVQIPVPEGILVRGRAQGPDAWDYELIVEAPPAQVADWYQQWMARASWKLVDASPRDDGGYNLGFAKGGAESRVEVTRKDNGARVLAGIGVGAPVLETQ